MPRPIDNHQASLALTQFIPLQGIFPGQLDPGEPQRDPGGIPLGSIRTFAGNFAPGGSDAAEGQPLPLISQKFPGVRPRSAPCTGATGSTISLFQTWMGEP